MIKTTIDDVVKQHGIMGVVVFTTIANKNLPDATQAQIMFIKEVMSFIQVTQQTVIKNRNPLQ